MSRILIVIAAAALGALIYYRARQRRLLSRLDEMLERAQDGDFHPEDYDETELSKLEARMSRFLAAAKLRRGSLESEQTRIHELISDISHQTKTPITNILLYLQLLAEQPELSDESRSYAAEAGAGAEKLSFLIQSLIKSSRLESGIVQIERERRDLCALAAAAVSDCRAAAQKKGVSLTLETSENPVFAMLDARWCREAVYNIIDNAVKYTPPGGSVSVSVRDFEMFAAVRVADTGKGVSEDDLPKIFARFYRAADSSGEDGVGIGLYLAREIIQRSGGYIHATSEPGAGSVFTAYLSKL